MHGTVSVDLKHLIGHLLKECIKPALQDPKSFYHLLHHPDSGLKERMGINGLKELMDLPVL